MAKKVSIDLSIGETLDLLLYLEITLPDCVPANNESKQLLKTIFVMKRNIHCQLAEKSDPMALVLAIAERENS